MVDITAIRPYGVRVQESEEGIDAALAIWSIDDCVELSFREHERFPPPRHSGLDGFHRESISWRAIHRALDFPEERVEATAPYAGLHQRPESPLSDGSTIRLRGLCAARHDGGRRMVEKIVGNRDCNAGSR